MNRDLAISPRCHRQRGFTLVEILVSLAISLALVAGVVQIFMSSKITYSVQEGMSRLQENARFAINLLASDLRMANYLGCAQKSDDAAAYRNVLNTPNSFLWDVTTGIEGFEVGETVDPAVVDASALADSDVLSIKTVRGAGLTLTKSMSSSTDADLEVTESGYHVPKTGDVVLISDCMSTTVFQVTGYSGGIVKHATTGTPGNATADLGRRFRIGAKIYPIETVTYYLRDSGSGSGAALWRRVDDGNPEELVEGIENMQITYAVDDDNQAGTDQYVTADAVDDWDDVVAIRVAMLMRTPDEVNNQADTGTYTVNGTAYDPVDDRRLRRVFDTTINLRNRTF